MKALLTSRQSQLGIEPLEGILPVGSLVYVTCHGPCWGLRGIVQAVDVIPPADAPLYFYLVTLQEGQIKEPLWFVPDDVTAVEGENVSQWCPGRGELSQVEVEAFSIVANVSGREEDRSLETLSIAEREVVAV